MKTCPPVNFYSVQISPNTSPAHRFHWLAAQFCTGGGGICRNSQIGPRGSGPPSSHDNHPNRVPAAGLDHHVCLLTLIDPQRDEREQAKIRGRVCTRRESMDALTSVILEKGTFLKLNSKVSGIL